MGALAVLSACNNQPPPPHTGRVAILDIAVVSEKTGNTEVIGNKLKTSQAKYQEDLSKLQSDLQERISSRQKEFGKQPPTEEQRQEISRMMSNAQKEFSQAQAKASQSMQQEQGKLVMEFHDKIRPIARHAAELKGLSVVFLKNEAMMLDADPSVDITDAVVVELLKLEPLTEITSPEPVAEPMIEPVADEPMVEPAAEPAAEEVPATNETMMDSTNMKEESMTEKPAEADSSK